MKKLFFILSLFIANAFIAFSQEENPSFESYLKNVLTPRTNVIPCYDEEQIHKRNPKESISTFWLDEGWRFKYYTNRLDSAQAAFHTSKFDDETWAVEKIPSQWELNQKQSLAYKSETKEPLSVNADDFPKGVYRKKIVIPPDWKDRQVILHIGPANAGVKLWVNDQLVGYNFLSAQTVSEFDVTAFAKPEKEMFICLEVPFQTQASVWDISNNLDIHGISGDVFLYAKPLVNIYDYKVVADLDENYKNGLLKVSVNIENASQKSSGYFVELELKDEKDASILKTFKYFKVDKKERFTNVEFSETLTELKRWTAETPNLYTLTLRLKDSKQAELELVGDRVGFKKMEIKNGAFLINGVAVKLKGVNYSDYYSRKGFGMQPKDFLTDIRLMKSNNINAVRTMKTGIAEEFYKLCNEHGLYVFDEVASSVFNEKMNPAETNPLLLLQLQSAYESNKNNACIVAWSLGSRTQNGKFYTEAYKWLKQASSEIPIQCIAAETSWSTDIYTSLCNDLVSVSAYAARPQKQPMILVKYLTRYGNSLGGLKAYWEVFNTSPQLQGGFLSSWADQAQLSPRRTNDSLKFWQLPQKEINSATTFYGLVQADRTPHPELQEVKAVFANFEIRPVNIAEGEFEVTNLYDFVNLKNFELNYRIFSNLKESVSEGIITADVVPKAKKNISASIPKMKAYANEEYFIVFTLQQKEKGKILPHAYPLGSYTFPLKMDKALQAITPQSELFRISHKEDSTQWTIYNDDIEILFNKKTGDITSFSYNGKSLFVQAPKLNFWRPPTQNDELDENALQLWKSYGLKDIRKNVKSVSFKVLDETSSRIVLTGDLVNSQNTVVYNLAQTYTFYGNGDVFIENQLRPVASMISIPKVGMQFRISKDFGHAQWFGFENETYEDRKTSGLLGVYEKPLPAMFHHYSKPQTAGNRMETRWVSFTSPDSAGFFFGASSAFQFSAYPYSDSDIEQSLSAENLPEQNYWTVNIDKAFSPIGSTYCGESISEKMLLASNNLTFAVHLRPFEAINKNPDDFRLSKFNYSSEEILEAPLISANLKRFDTTMLITLETSNSGVEIRYTLNGKEPTENDLLYTQPFPIQNTCLVKAKTFKKGLMPSFTTSRNFQFNYIKDIVFEKAPNTPYNKDLKTCLFDGVHGKTNNFERYWLGFSGNDFSVTVETVKPIHLEKVSVGFGHVPETWVFLPSQMTVETSSDNINFSAPKQAVIPFDPKNEKAEKPLPVDLSVDINQENVRFVRIKATNIGMLPPWHPVKGLKAWLMVDEIQLEEKL